METVDKCVVAKNIFEELSGKGWLDAFILKNFDNFSQKLSLCQFVLARGIIKSDILIDPNAAFAVFIDQYHFISHVKGTKSVKKTLISYKASLIR